MGCPVCNEPYVPPALDVASSDEAMLDALVGWYMRKKLEHRASPALHQHPDLAMQELMIMAARQANDEIAEGDRKAALPAAF